MTDAPGRQETGTTAANLKTVFSGSFARSVLLVAQGLIVSRFLGPEGYGEFSLALAFVALVFGIIDFRVEHAVIKFMAEVEERPAQERQLLAIFFLSFEIAKGLLGYAAAVGFGYLFLVQVYETPVLMPMVAALAIYQLAMTANPTTTAFLRLAGKFRAIAVYDLAFGLISIIVVAGAAALFREPLAVAQAYLAVGIGGGLVKSILTWWLLRPAVEASSLRPLLLGWRDAELPWREMTRFILGVNLAATCVHAAKNLDVVILARFVPMEAVGWYSLAKRLKNLFGYVSDPMLIVLYPEFAKAWSAQRLQWLRKTLLRTMGWGFLLATLGFLGLALAARFLVPLVFGGHFGGATLILWFFLLDAVANGTFFALPHLVLAMGRAGDTFRGALARLLLVVSLGPLLCALWGAPGMAIALGVATSVNMLLLLRTSQRGFADP